MNVAGSLRLSARAGCDGVVALPGTPRAVAGSALRAARSCSRELDRRPRLARSTSSIRRRSAGTPTSCTASPTALGVDLGIFFARKANKALALVDEARRLAPRGRPRERARAEPGPRARRPGSPTRHDGRRQAGGAARAVRRAPARRSWSTTRTSCAARRTRGLRRPRAASRCGSPRSWAPERPHTRFGFELARCSRCSTALVARRTVRRSRSPASTSTSTATTPADRVQRRSGRRSSSSTRCASAVTRPAFVDIGGGIPMSYLDVRRAVGAVLERAPRGAARRCASRSRSRATASACSPTAARSSGVRPSTRTHSSRPRGAWLDARPGGGAHAAGERSRRRGPPRARTATALRARARAARRLRPDGRTRRVPQAAPRRDVADRRRR